MAAMPRPRTQVLDTSNEPVRSIAPLFRWPGGKRWLVPTLREIIPQKFGRYFEPFFGAGALYFALLPSVAIISDINADLMACYRTLRDKHREVADAIGAMPRDRESFYRIRDQDPSSDVEAAARFIYLTTLAFNGIYRVNRAGRFNVPFGDREYGQLGGHSQLETYGQALNGASVLSGDFEFALEGANSGDVVYVDPPYTVAHSNNGFIKYNDRLFSWKDQERLARVVAELDRRGCAVLVSNAHHDSIARLYPEFRRMTVARHSVMAADSAFRGRIQEYLLTNLG